MTKITLSAALAALIAGPALAGGNDVPVETPAVAAPAPVIPVASGTDWTGFYLGGSLGTADVNDGDLDGQGLGIHGGYNYDLGNIVLGGELDYSRVQFDDSDAEADVLRLKGRVGYDAGNFLPYVTAGFAQIDSDDLGLDSEDGAVYGVGADFAVTDNVLVGAEFLRHDFDDADTEVDTFGVRASFKF